MEGGGGRRPVSQVVRGAVPLTPAVRQVRLTGGTRGARHNSRGDLGKCPSPVKRKLHRGRDGTPDFLLPPSLPQA